MFPDGIVIVKEFDSFGFKAKGIFADKNLPTGTLVWFAHPSESESEYNIDLTSEEIFVHKPKESRDVLKRFGYVIGDDLYSTTLHPELDQGWFFNHSCDPNCWITENNKIYTLRDIKEGEHLCYDYSTTETEASTHYGMVCKCGAAECRKRLTFSEWRSKEFMKKYAGRTTMYLRHKHEEHRWLDPRLMLRFQEKERRSYGLFVIRQPEFSFEKGEVVINLKLQQEKDGNHSNLANPIDQIQHSSEPSCKIVETNLLALRGLGPGDEITYDYNSQNMFG